MDLQDIDIYWIMIGLSLTIILSYSFNYISKISKVPSVILLILTGFIASFFLPLEMDLLRPFLEFLGAVGLIMIVLEASLDLKLQRDKTLIMTKAVIVALILLVSGALVIGWLIAYFYQVPLTQALFYSIPLSIMSSAIIIPTVHHLDEQRKEFLIYEAAFSDILGIMFFYFLEDSLNRANTTEVSVHIASNIGITLLVAFVLGHAVILLMQRVKAQVKLFLPIAILILLYSVGKLFHLSSLIFILAFGLMINNRNIFFRKNLLRLFRVDNFEDTFQDLKLLTLETSFIVRTFFFIVFGMTITGQGLNDPMIYVVGFGALIIMVMSRFGVFRVIERKRARPAMYIAPRGLISILLFFAIPEAQAITGFNPTIFLIVIIGSNLVMTYGLMKYKPEIAPGETEVQTEEIVEESREITGETGHEEPGGNDKAEEGPLGH